jgi:ABC-type Zn uptake system ZnuABC Zn-binding protein ZnuA
MKFKKIILLILVGVITLTSLTGCFGSKKIEKAKILTTTYALQYLVENLVSNPGNVSTIYPAGVNTDEYTLTDKQISTFAKKNSIFVYNGLTKERKIALNLINTNKNLVVVDCTKGMNIINDGEELFISPSNYLMLAQNMKNDFLEQTTSRVTKEDIEKKYEKLKLTISTYDASLKEIASLAKNKTLVVGDDAFLFLEKYGFTVLSVENKENGAKNDMQAAKEAVANKSVSNIFVLSTNQDSDNIKKLVDAGATKVVVTSMTNLSEADKNANVNYETIMNNFIEAIRTEVYN